MKIDHIYNQPCGAMEEIPDDTIDVVVTSPPYNLACRSKNNKKHNIVYDEFDDHVPQDQYEDEQVAILDSCARVLNLEIPTNLTRQLERGLIRRRRVDRPRLARLGLVLAK